MKKKKTGPAAVAFHGVEIRARDPESAARRAAGILGWPVLRRTRREIVLGEGPKLFIRIVRAGRDEDDRITGIHLAVEELSRNRRKTEPDSLGGDSRTEELTRGAALTLREFKRAPRGEWKPKRRRA